MAGCLCRPWAEASQREIKKRQEFSENKGRGDKTLRPFFIAPILRLAIDSGEALQSSVRYQALRKMCEYKTYPNDGSILGIE
jgi:hypothetical protein